MLVLTDVTSLRLAAANLRRASAEHTERQREIKELADRTENIISWLTSPDHGEPQ